MHKLCAAALAVAFMAFSASAAQALPGDRAIDSSRPFRLQDRTLEPGCFVPHRYSDADIDSHLTIGLNPLSEEMHVTVEDGASFSVDQVLVPSPIDGYNVVNRFDTGTINNDDDIDPGQTATGLRSPTRFIDDRDVIICVSGHSDPQNEPYQQEDSGLVSAKNRPVLTPKVTAFGVSALTDLKTYRIGFGYDATKWYVKPAFLDAEDHPLFIPTVTDPNGFFSPTFGDNLPAFVTLFPRRDGDYDARRVNDVDKAGESWTAFPGFDESSANDHQTFLFSQNGDLTAWADDPVSRHDARNLFTDLTQGDFPISWTLRPSLAAPSSKRKVTFTLTDYFAWNKSWQDYYAGKGPLPSLPLAPGTNSPAPDPTITVIVNPQVTLPAPTPSNPNPTPQPVAPVTVGGVTPSGGNAISNAVAGANKCTSTRVIKFSWAKGTKKGTLRYWNKRASGRMVNGRLRANADFRGYTATHGDVLKVTQIGVRQNGRVVVLQRLFKAC